MDIAILLHDGLCWTTRLAICHVRFHDLPDSLTKALKPAIIDRTIQKHNALRFIKARELKIRSVKDFLDKEKE